jgi:hypothetical protein
MFNNFKKLGIVLFLLIAVVGFTCSSVNAGKIIFENHIIDSNNDHCLFIENSNGKRVKEHTLSTTDKEYTFNLNDEYKSLNFIIGVERSQGPLSYTDIIKVLDYDSSDIRIYIEIGKKTTDLQIHNWKCDGNPYTESQKGPYITRTHVPMNFKSNDPFNPFNPGP